VPVAGCILLHVQPTDGSRAFAVLIHPSQRRDEHIRDLKIRRHAQPDGLRQFTNEMIAVVRDRIPVGLLSRLRFPQRDLKPGVLCSIKGSHVGRRDRELQDIRIPDRVRGHWEDMAHRHDEVISHRMQVGVMRVGWFAPSVEPTVGNVAVSVGANLRDTEIDVIAIGRGRSRFASGG